MAIYGVISLPYVIPTHVGPSGGIDSYGNKWVLITLLTGFNIALYAFITFINRYPHVFNYPIMITAENALGIYRISQRMMLWLKIIFSWQLTVMLGWFVLVLSYHPERSSYTILVAAPFLLLIGLNILYSVVLIIKEANKPGTT
jgi:hypothetical protein